MESKNNPYLVINEAKKGVCLQAFNDFVDESGYSKTVIAGFVGIDMNTIFTNEESFSFQKRQAEHLIKLKKLFGQGRELFGGKQEFKRWLVKPFFGLGERTPEQLLSYFSGIDLVDRELHRIECGDFS